MTAQEFLALWLVLTITVGYLGLVALWCLLLPRFISWYALVKVALRHKAWGAASQSCGSVSLPPDAAMQQQP